MKVDILYTPSIDVLEEVGTNVYDLLMRIKCQPHKYQWGECSVCGKFIMLEEDYEYED